jgi:hypothetical protein
MPLERAHLGFEQGARRARHQIAERNRTVA